MKPSFLILIIIALLLISSCSFNEKHEYPYISSVYEYVYGVGQHAQNISYESSEYFKGENSNYVMLGGWGGYIVAGFDHVVTNRHGFYDIAIFAQGGVGNEPSVIFVMQDTNKNSLPDDTWYEISGSETDKGGYQQHAVVTYYKQDDDSLPMFYTINGDNTVTYNLINGFGENTTSTWWWPSYDTLLSTKHHGITKGSDFLGSFISFRGTLLPNSKVENNGNWDDILGRFTHGYGENYTGEDFRFVPFGRGKKGANLIDIDDAIDGNGDPVELGYINFIKVQTGVLQVCGPLNEISSEIAGAGNLNHIQGDWSR